MTRGLFLWLSRNGTLKKLSREFYPFWKMASRFIAGHSLDEAVEVVKKLNSSGLKVTLDHLGENTTTPEEAVSAGDAYIQILDRIQKEKLDATISVKLTQLGMDISDRLVKENIERITAQAYHMHNFVRIDMESSEYTQKTLDIYYWLKGKYNGSIGIVIQTYLYRCEDDIKKVIAEGGNVRLVKGAYNEPPDIAFPKKRDVDLNYKRMLDLLLSHEAISRGTFTAVATHDEKLINYAKSLISERSIPLEYVEFQMLYGIRTDLQYSLVNDGYTVRVYVPFGDEWYPYFMRRLAERPANVIFLLKNLMK